MSSRRVNKNASQIVDWYSNSFDLKHSPMVVNTYAKSCSPPPMKVVANREGLLNKRSVWGSTEMFNHYEVMLKRRNNPENTSSKSNLRQGRVNIK